MESVSAADALRMLKVEQLHPGKYQPRMQMDQESLTHLADSIRAQGIMQPILARQMAPERFEIIAGERRWRAAQLAGLHELPVLVREIADEAALAMSLIENIQRENLNPLEEAAGIKRLIDEFSMTHQVASEAIGRSRAAVTNLLRLLNLAPPVQELLMHGRIDMGHARSLLALEGAKQITVATQIAHRGLSVREAEKMVKRAVEPKRRPSAEKTDPDVERLEEELSETMGAQVRIQSGRGGSGTVVIRFHSLDQLEGLVAMLKSQNATLA
jgi:ParB family chromosome partitioning protein